MSLFAGSQIILVTGASSGIGLACAMEANAQGAVIIANGRNSQKLRDAREHCAYPEHWHNESLDLYAEIDNLQIWLEELRKKYGQFYGLVHCAGVGSFDSLAGIDLEEARNHFDMNFFVPLMLAKSFSDRRNCRPGASMLFIASIAGVHPEKGHILYGSAKSALITAVKVISQELANRGIRANAISPGSIETPLLESTLTSIGPKYLAEQRSRYPFGFGKPDDVANLACFLLSGKARWITGQNFILSGGAY